MLDMYVYQNSIIINNISRILTFSHEYMPRTAAKQGKAVKSFLEFHYANNIYISEIKSNFIFIHQTYFLINNKMKGEVLGRYILPKHNIKRCFIIWEYSHKCWFNHSRHLPSIIYICMYRNTMNTVLLDF